MVRAAIRLAVALLLFSVSSWAACSSALTPSAPLAQGLACWNVGSGDTVDVVMPSNQVAGHSSRVSVTACQNSSCNVSAAPLTISVSDDAGNSYALVENNVTGVSGVFVRVASYLAANIPSGANTIHVSATSGAAYLTVMATEWAAAASPLDQSGQNQGTSGTITVSTSMATTQANEIVVATGGGGNSTTEGMGYTRLFHDAGSLLMAEEYKTVSATGVQTATWTMSSASWWVVIDTQKYTPASGSVQSGGVKALMGVGR